MQTATSQQTPTRLLEPTHLPINRRNMALLHKFIPLNMPTHRQQCHPYMVRPQWAMPCSGFEESPERDSPGSPDGAPCELAGTTTSVSKPPLAAKRDSRRRRGQGGRAGYREACTAAQKRLEGIALDHSSDAAAFRRDLLNIARTTLSSKILTQAMPPPPPNHPPPAHATPRAPASTQREAGLGEGSGGENSLAHIKATWCSMLDCNYACHSWWWKRSQQWSVSMTCGPSTP